MTTVVFDGRTIAVDRGAWGSLTRTQVQKLFNIRLCTEATQYYNGILGATDQVVYAAAGPAAMTAKYERFLDFGIGSPQDIHSDYDLGLLICCNTGRCFNVTASGELVLYTDLPIAGGAGRDMGIVLLGAGMKAEEVILHIAKYSSASALGVDSYTLPDDVNYYGIK